LPCISAWLIQTIPEEGLMSILPFSCSQCHDAWNKFLLSDLHSADAQTLT
jgi:hypothetical protein